MPKILFLIDDQSGKWMTKAVWFPKEWSGWDVVTFNQSAIRSIDKTAVQAFFGLVSEHVLNNNINAFYVVTDAQMGRNASAGAELLELLLDKGLVRGVVYSSNPVLTDKATASGKCAVVIRGAQNDVAIIRAFFENGIWPKEYLRSIAVRVLSEAIHRLDNTLLPLRADVETLSAQNLDTGVLNLVWEDYFGKVDGTAYLSKKSKVHAWTSAEHNSECGDICELFSGVWACVSQFVGEGNNGGELLNAFETAVGNARTRTCNKDHCEFSAKELRDALDSVMQAGEKIVQTLREKRHHIMENLAKK
ncbi:MAG: hypothetical protein KAV87_22165 [Desulfobacteraceae bacterium]|nr:hypothetical protein [Desulfobacteraceae bacterium]